MNTPSLSNRVAQPEPAESRAARRPGPELSVLIPTFNEAGNMPELLRRISRVVSEAGVTCEAVVLDDHSPDGTAEAARHVEVLMPVRVVERTGPKGLGPAIIDGLRLAKGEHLLVMDADLQHPPESLTDLLNAVRQGADFVIGSRFVPGGSMDDFGLYRRLNSKVATLLTYPLIGAGVRDPMAGFFCFRRSLVEGRIDELNPVGFKIGLEILAKCRPTKVAEVPIRFGTRHAGDSKMVLSQQIDYLRHLRRLYGWRWPTLTQAGLFCAVGTAGMAVDLGVMTGLVQFGVAFYAARVLSILLAMLFNFALNRRITFPEASSVSWGRQLAKFVAVCSVGMVINWSVSSALYASLPGLRRVYQLCCVAGVVAGTISNFLLSKFVAFRVSGSPTRPSAS